MLGHPLPVLVLVLTLALAPVTHADDHTPTDLTAPFEVTLGHFFAVNLHQTLQTFADLDKWDAPFSTIYDAKKERIEVGVLGARESVQGATESVERFRRELLGMALVGANHVCGTEVTAEQVSIVYFNRAHWKEIIRYRDGKYAIPE